MICNPAPGASKFTTCKEATDASTESTEQDESQDAAGFIPVRTETHRHLLLFFTRAAGSGIRRRKAFSALRR
jgi:hypothetical protein